MEGRRDEGAAPKAAPGPRSAQPPACGPAPPHSPKGWQVALSLETLSRPFRLPWWVQRPQSAGLAARGRAEPATASHGSQCGEAPAEGPPPRAEPWKWFPWAGANAEQVPLPPSLPGFRMPLAESIWGGRAEIKRREKQICGQTALDGGGGGACVPSRSFDR